MLQNSYCLRSPPFKAVTWGRLLTYSQKCCCPFVFATPLWVKALKPIRHTFKCPQCWQNCLLRKHFLFSSQKSSRAGTDEQQLQIPPTSLHTHCCWKPFHMDYWYNCPYDLFAASTTFSDPFSTPSHSFNKFIKILCQVLCQMLQEVIVWED